MRWWRNKTAERLAALEAAVAQIEQGVEARLAVVLQERRFGDETKPLDTSTIETKAFIRQQIAAELPKGVEAVLSRLRRSRVIE